MYYGGYAGKILRINLTDESTAVEDLPVEMAQHFLGGVGFGIKYLQDEVKPDIEPLSSSNRLIFSVGPLTVTGVNCTSRMSVVAKSPLTGAIGAAFAGGNFPSEIKRAGYDTIIIEGKAKKPSYIVIKNSEVSFHSAEKLWGISTSDTQEYIKQEIKDHNFRIACIGPAGENLVYMAAIINERRAAGRKGLGAVMGSKNLKAIAIHGNNKPHVFNMEKLTEARRLMNTSMRKNSGLFSEFALTGSSNIFNTATQLGICPINNYSATGQIDLVENLGIEANLKYKIRKYYCADCPVGCAQVRLVNSGPYAGFSSEGPEYESLYALGSNVGITYLPAVIAADRICDELGLDTMSAGTTIAFAMELYEKGIITKSDTDGLELKFGNHSAMIQMLQRIAYRKGLGEILSKGVRQAAKIIGKDSEKYALHVKGLELPGYDPRGAKAQGLNYATAYVGADHNRGFASQEIYSSPIPASVNRFSIDRKGWLTKWNQDYQTAVGDCSTICAFVMDAIGVDPRQTAADLINAATGSIYSTDDIMKIGERINNVSRLFNIRAGFGREDDTLPDRILSDTILDGASKGHSISKTELEQMLNEYYFERGWDDHGNPSMSKLQELGLA